MASQLEWVRSAEVKGLNRDRLLGHGAMLITVGLWGISFVSIKVAVDAVPPVTVAMIRFALSSFLLLLLLRKREPGVKTARTDWLRLGFAGFLGVTLYYILENMGVHLSTASNAALITAVIPIMATALDVLIYRTRLSGLQLAGLLLSLAGTYLAVSANGQVSFDSAHFKGNLWMAGAMITWSVYTLYSKSLGSRYSGLRSTACQQLVGTALLIPAALTEYQAWAPVAPTVWLHILFLAVCCSAGCYLLYTYALRRLDVASTTLYLNLVPLIGVAGGYVLLGERILPVQLAGGAVILLGIVAVNWAQPKKEIR